MTDYIIRPMQVADINQIMQIERKVYTMPWPAFVFVHEINHNNLAHMMVIEATLPEEDVDEDKKKSPLSWLSRLSKPHRPFVGYGGVWMDYQEGHISTVVSPPDFRGQGFGYLVMLALLGKAVSLGMKTATLEVRISNQVAINLYKKLGFEITGNKYAYYRDNDEDAHIMTIPALDENYQQFLRDRFADAHQRIAFEDVYSEFNHQTS